MEEILHLLRTQNSLLSNPEMLLPRDYINFVLRKINENKVSNSENYLILIEDLISYLTDVIKTVRNFVPRAEVMNHLNVSHIDELFDMLLNRINGRKYREQYMHIKRLYDSYMEIIASSVMGDKDEVMVPEENIIRRTIKHNNGIE